MLHGWQNRRPKGHWQFELVHDLRSRGERVRYPRVLLVAPPSPRVLAGIPEIAPFSGVQHDQIAIRRAAGSTRLVAADDDPYCPEGIDAAYGSLRLDTDVISGGRHLDLDAGYGEWPSVLAWCLDPDVRLTARGLTR